MHTKTAKSKKCHQCEICDKKIYGSKYDFNNHLFQHGVINPRFTCSYCSKGYYRRDTYNWHMQRHTNKKRMYTCDHCERSFVDKRNLIQHLKIHDDLFINCTKEFYCTACSTNYCEQRLLDNHIRKKHFSFHEREPYFLKKKLNETWIEKVKGSESYVEMTKVNNNVLKIKRCDNIKNEAGDLGKCDKNDYSEYVTTIFDAKNKTQYSMAVCDYCKKEMVKKSLNNHIRERHLKLRRFNCKKCSEKFNRHYQLVNHICGKFKSKKWKNLK